jgi:hypothetical protein
VSIHDTWDVDGISGDRNPLHADAAVARTSRLGGLIAGRGDLGPAQRSGGCRPVGAGRGVAVGAMGFAQGGCPRRHPCRLGKVLTVRQDGPICTRASTIGQQRGRACLRREAGGYVTSLTSG